MVQLVLLLVAFALLLLGSALFSAIETAFFALQPADIERLKGRRENFEGAFARLMENPRRLLAAILLGEALVNLPLILLCLFLLREYLWPDAPAAFAILLIFTLVVFPGDLLPKLAALAQPNRVVRLGVAVMRRLLPVVDPLAAVLQRFAEWVARTVAPERTQPATSLSEEEFETLVELSAEEGALHATESEIIQEIVKLKEKTVRDCMTPRVDTFAVPDDLTNEQLIPQLRARRYRRVPVYGDTPDEIAGILDVRQFLMQQDGEHYTELLAPPSFVPETMKALDLLRSFLRHPQAVAIVVDEHGGTEGMVTMADIVEEIISDAVPQADRALYIEPLGEGRLIVNGNARLEDVNETLGIELEEEGIDTIGGLIFNRLGLLPKPGTRVELGGVAATIRRTSRKRVEEILLEPSPGKAAEGANV